MLCVCLSGILNWKKLLTALLSILHHDLNRGTSAAVIWSEVPQSSVSLFLN